MLPTPPPEQPDSDAPDPVDLAWEDERPEREYWERVVAERDLWGD
jgi:hypothetical protein